MNFSVWYCKCCDQVFTLDDLLQRDLILLSILLMIYSVKLDKYLTALFSKAPHFLHPRISQFL